MKALLIGLTLLASMTSYAGIPFDLSSDSTELQQTSIEVENCINVQGSIFFDYDSVPGQVFVEVHGLNDKVYPIYQGLAVKEHDCESGIFKLSKDQVETESDYNSLGGETLGHELISFECLSN